MRARTLIIGGGIGGLAAANALAGENTAIKVCEQSLVLREVGAGLTLWPNAIAAARAIGLGDAILGIANRVSRMEVWDQEGRRLNAVDLGWLERRFGNPTVCVHRAELLGALAQGAQPAELLLAKQCTGVEVHGREAVARFADGTEAVADLLVGADGVGSVVRQSLVGTRRFLFTGWAGWRGVAEVPHPLGSDHALVVVGPGALMGIFPIPHDRVYWFIDACADEGGVPPPGTLCDAVRERYGHWTSPVRDLLEATAEDVLRFDLLYDQLPLWHWSRGPATLLGDAAHPMAPCLGQGACQAIEDALVLQRAIGSSGSIADALASYERRRRWRAASVVVQSRVAGFVQHLWAPGRDAFGRLVPSSILTRQFGRVMRPVAEAA